MHRLACPVPLEHKYARTLRKLEILLNNHGSGQAIDRLMNKHVIDSEILIPVGRNTNIAKGHEGSYSRKNLTHRPHPPAIMLRPQSFLVGPANASRSLPPLDTRRNAA